MIYSSNIIFLLIQLLLVQSADPNLNYYYQKLLTTTNRLKFLPTSSVPTKDRPPVSYRHAFHEQFYSKTQATTLLPAIYTIHHSNKRSADDYQDMSWFHDWYTTKPRKVFKQSEVSCASHDVKQCGDSGGKWKSRRYCCPNDQYCGIGGGCDEWPTTSLLVSSIIFLLCLITCAGVACDNCENHVQSNNPVINTRSTIELLETSTQPNDIFTRLLDTRQNMENPNVGRPETQNWIIDIPPRNSIGLIEQQLLQNDNDNMRSRTATSSSLPTYDDVVRQSSTTITMEQLSLLPPSYNDFIRGN